jgi:dTDP-4-amino-4,6-dideoxygalactose transaminase
MFGINSRLDSLQAAALNVKVQHLDAWLDRRRAIAGFYNEALAATACGTDLGGGRAGSAFYHYVVRSSDRDELQRHLAEHGIEAAIHYPIPIHLQRAWLSSQPSVSLPHTERLAREILSIPCHHHLSDADVEWVATTIRRFRHRSATSP